MAKPKKKDLTSNKQGDEKQTKISNFFENKPQKGESALFTKVRGPNKTKGLTRSHTSGEITKTDKESGKQKVGRLTRVVSDSGNRSTYAQGGKKSNDKDDEDDIVCLGSTILNKPAVSLQPANNANPQLQILEENKGKTASCAGTKGYNLPHEPLYSLTTANPNVRKEGSGAFLLVTGHDDAAEIPKQALAKAELFTPKKDQQGSISDSSPEIICDTPGVDSVLQEASSRRKKLYANSRSFLRSADLVSVQPGLKPAHLNAHGKVRPRKLLGTVSVSFKENSKLDASSTNSSGLHNTAQASDTNDVSVFSESAKGREANERNAGKCMKTSVDSANNNQSELSLSKPLKMATAPSQLCSIPETQLFEQATSPPLVIEGQGVNQNNMDKQERLDYVLDMSSHQLDLASETYPSTCANNEDLEMSESGAFIHDNSVPEEKSVLERGLFPAKSISWDRGEETWSSRQTLGSTETEAGCKGSLSNAKSKLLGALQHADGKEDETNGREWLKDQMLKELCLSPQSKDTTPVKIYSGENVTVKRQAKPGMSPLSKRIQPSDYVGDSSEYVRIDTNLVVPHANKAKKILNLEQTRSTSLPQKNTFKKSNKFTRQRALEFGLKPKENYSDSDKGVTLEDDKLLADLLVDLNPPEGKENLSRHRSITKHSHSHKTNSSNEATLKLDSNKSIGQNYEKYKQKSANENFLKKDEKLLDSLFGESFMASEDISDEVTIHANLHNSFNDEDGLIEPILIEESQEPEKEENWIMVDESFDGSPSKLDTLPINGSSGMDTHKIPHDNELANSQGLNVPLGISAQPLSTVNTTSDILKFKPKSTNAACETHGEPFSTDTTILDQSDSERYETDVSKAEAALISTASVNENPGSMVSNNSIKGMQVETFQPKQILCSSHDTNGHASAFKAGDELTNKDALPVKTLATTDGLLSTSIYDMLSESFDDELFHPESKALVKSEQDFVFTDLWNRFLVTDVSHNREADELLLNLSSDRKGSACQCALRGFWADSEIKVGDIVNVLADLEDGMFVVDDRKGLIVINPDLLLAGTLVVSAVFCPRKSVLNEQFKGVDKGNVQMLYGNIIHSLFQEVMRSGTRRQQDIEALAASQLKSSKFLHEMYGQNLAESTVMGEIGLYVPSLMSWLSKHTSEPKSSYGNFKTNKKSDLVVTEIQDIEENIWSPRFGLKGKIDLTVQAEVRKPDKGSEVKVLPLELKTGKASFSSEHKGQVTLYSMMSSDRREDPKEGILLYLKHGEMQTIPTKLGSKNGLIQLRNKLASDLSRQVSMEMNEDGSKTYILGHLPQPINNERACSKCAHLQTCSIYQSSVEKVELSSDHAMSNLAPEAMRHLTEADLAYFLHWVLCLDVERRVSGRTQLSQIWCGNSQQRENDGDCLSNLIITGSELGVPETQSFSEGKGCSLTFSRHPDFPGAALNTVGLTANDMVVLSSEDGRFIALSTGFVRRISSMLVEIVVDRDYLHQTTQYQDVRFRLDKNDSFSTSGYLYTNLSKLMDPTPQMTRLRDLIIKNRPPEFELKVSKACLYKVKSVFKPLNKPQRTAILKVLMAKDYVLIKGYPGTGKTSTIVSLVKILNILGLSVLLTSYTHSAVDNILLKLKKDGVPFLRLGRQGRIHPSILPHCSEILTNSPSIDSVQALKEFYDSYSIVATSCLGVSGHPVFSQRQFDVCVVDEASQVLQPACLGPLFHCRKFVLVGDPRQLPPVVQSKEARNLGMDESLFARLDNRGATYDLNLQYRMNRVIMDLSNKLVYEGQLQCGSPSVGEQSLQVDSTALMDQPQWIRSALSNEIQNSVVFVDTQTISAPETQDGKGIKNETEANIVLMLLRGLVNAKVCGESVGVVSPYRSQVKLLQQRARDCPSAADVEVNTVDQYQGRDKAVILVSFVRSEMSNAGELLNDLRRLNVALTRARYKLILIGNAAALKVYPSLALILQWLGDSENIVQLPENYAPGT